MVVIILSSNCARVRILTPPRVGGFQACICNCYEPAVDRDLAEIREPQMSPNQLQFLKHLVGQRIDIFDKPLIRLLREAGIWGSIRHDGLLGNTVIVSDDAGQFRVGNHALCWVHGERLLQKPMPATPEQARRVEMTRDLIWRYSKALKGADNSPLQSALTRSAGVLTASLPCAPIGR